MIQIANISHAPASIQRLSSSSRDKDAALIVVTILELVFIDRIGSNGF